MPNLPPLPARPLSNWDWVVAAIQALHQDHQTLSGQVTVLTMFAEDTIMSSISDLATAVSGLDAKVDALIAAYNNAKNNPATHLDAADQTALDAAVSALSSESGAVDTANPPAPAPAPNPTPAPAPPAPTA